MALEISRNARVLSNASEEDTTVAVTCSAAATTITVTSIASLPVWASGKQYRLLLTLGASDPSQDELVLVTSVAGNVLTVTRALESTTAVEHAAGTLVYMVQSEGWRANNPGILSIAGDLAYVTTGGDMARLPIGSDNQVLTVSAGLLPNWEAPATHGDVVGPASSTDEAIVRFDGTTGKLIQDYTSMAPTVDDTGHMTIGDVSAFVTPTPRLHVEEDFSDPPSTGPGGDIIHEVIRGAVRSHQSGTVQQGRVAVGARCYDDADVVNKAISNAANNGSGLIRITAASNAFITGDRINVYNVGGTTEANGVWTITVINATTFDLDGSTFTNAYTSGGTATNRGLMYGFRAFLNPILDRGGLQGTGASGDDVNGLAIHNIGIAKATEAIFVANSGNVSGSGWFAVFSSNANADIGVYLTGEHADYGVAVVGPHTANDSTTHTYIDGYFYPTMNFGGSNSNKTVDVVRIDTVNTSVTGATIRLLKANYGGTERLALTSTGLFTVSNESNQFIAAANYTNDTGGAGFKLMKYRGTTAAPLRVQSGDTVGSLACIGGYAVDNTTAAQTTANTANFRFVAQESYTSTTTGTKFELRTVTLGTTTLTTRLIVDTGGVRIGQTQAARSTTQGTNQLEIYDGTAPAGTLSGGIALYSTSGELWVMDAAGNATQLSPHDRDSNDWVFDSVQTTTGKRVRIEVERLLRALDQQLGGGYIHEESHGHS